MSGFRVFVAGSAEIECRDLPAGVEEAYDLMAADGVPPQKAADLAMAAHRTGRDPVAFARHFVSVRQAVRR